MADVAGILEAVEKVSPGAGDALATIALYELYLDYSDAEVRETHDHMRGELVRKFVDARLAQVDVAPLLEAAGRLTLIDYEISKADASYLERHNERQDAHGRFTRLHNTTRATSRTLTAEPKTGDIQGGIARLHASPNKRSMIGQGLMSLNHPGAQATGVALDLVGQLGPEAQAVFGDHLKRAAYRYRGTERNPDPRLTRRMNRADLVAAELTSSEEAYRNTGAARFRNYKATPVLGDFQRARGDRPTDSVMPTEMAIADYNAKAYTERVTQEAESIMGWPSKHPDVVREYDDLQESVREQTLLDTRADVAAAYLLPKIVSPAKSKLSEQAGKVPPSQGILIDRDGRVVSQAVGYNGDHYLPFDLKNLKALSGGQYVRTRVYGGPTAEDIYTGLMTGARQVTVVSNTGVFTLEFDPDLRGGRRYNDKARQMVGRYQRILETINSGNAKTGQIDPAKMKELRDQALIDANGDPEAAAKEFLPKAIKREEARLKYEGQDEDHETVAREDALANATAALRRGTPEGAGHRAIMEDQRRLTSERKAEAFDRGFGTLRLDAYGYRRAMEALQEEFPFYVRRVDHTPLERWQDQRGLVDEDTKRPAILGASTEDKAFVSSEQTAYRQNRLSRTKPVEGEKSADNAEGGSTKESAPTASAKPKAAAKTWDGSLTEDEQDDVAAVTHSIVRSDKYKTGASSLYVKDATLENVSTPADMHHWITDKRADVVRSFTALTATQQDDVLAAISKDFDSSTKEEDNPAQAKAIEEQMTQLRAALLKVAPFGEEATSKNMRRTVEEGSRPLAFSEITAAGPDRHALTLWRRSITSGKLEAQIKAYESADDDEIVDAINDEIVALKRTDASERPTEEHQETLSHLHAARAYLTAYRLAKEPGPKASAPAPGLPEQEKHPVGFAKKQVSYKDRLVMAMALLEG